MNYRHLYCFWAAAKAGGIVRGAQQMSITPQTLSTQIKLLEDALGRSLFRKSGRRVELTEDGRVALGYADQIFALGAELETRLGPGGREKAAIDLRVGIADQVPKALAYRLIEPGLEGPDPVRLVCHEGKLQDLLAQLSVHRLDIVIADEPMASRLSVKAFNHPLGATGMSFFAAPSLKRGLKGAFPACLNGAPMLVQGAGSAMRRRLERWFAEHGLRPRLVGEFDDAALMLAFGHEGRGIFMTPSVLEEDTCRRYGMQVVGRTSELVEQFFAISVERRITHPSVAAITESARGSLLA